jgi:putative sterol carrier protein
MPTTETLIAAMRTRGGDLRSLGYRVKFALTDTDETILLDARDGSVTIEPADREADAVLRLSSDDLDRLIAGRLSPMLAFSTGRLRVDGSRGVALKLASLLDD